MPIAWKPKNLEILSQIEEEEERIYSLQSTGKWQAPTLPTPEERTQRWSVPTREDIIGGLMAPVTGLEHLGKGMAATALSPFYKSAGAPAVETWTPEAVMPSGRLQEAYEQWQTPSVTTPFPLFRFPWTPTEERQRKWEVGPKGWIEFAPWLLLGGVKKPPGTAKILQKLAKGKKISKAEEGVLEKATQLEAKITKPTAENLVARSEGLALEEKAVLQKASQLQKEAKPIAELPIGVTKEPVVETAIPSGVTYLPPVERLATNTQKVQIHRLAYTKNLIDPTTKKVRPQYRRLAKAMTGKKSTTEMTESEANYFIEAIEGLTVKGGRPPKIPVSTGVITKEFADKIPMLNEIGIIEKVRPTRQVFEKIGLRKEIWEPAFKAEIKIYEDLMAFRRELAGVSRLVGKSAERRQAVFEALENPSKVVELTENEKEAVKWFRKYFDKWADDLKLAPEKRRQNYVTHIFEKEIAQELAATHQLDPALVRALDYVTPKRVFNPYLEKRLGQRIGLKQDPFAATEAYEGRALKVFHYEPLIQRIRAYERYLPPNSARYLRDFITRITGRPLTIDREVNETLKQFAGMIEHLPGGKKLGGLLTKGNMGGLFAYQYASLLYFCWLGFKPTSAIRNLGQHALALAEVGPVNFAKGCGLRFTKEGKEALKECAVLRSRRQALLPGIDATFASRWTDTIREKALWMFRGADRQNVSDTFLSGYAEAKALKLPKEWCIKRGNEVAADTQYIYTQLGGASWSQSALGRALAPLTTWPENWLELMARWIKGRPSYVYREYAEATGKEIIPKASWEMKRKAVLLYLALVSTAYGVEKTTKLKATQYTGWTSMRYLVDMARGQLPALDLPGGVAQIVGGALLGDMTLLKQGWNRVRPDRLMGIIRQLENVAEGKTDWLSLFVYLNPEKEEEGRPPRTLPSQTLPPRR